METQKVPKEIYDELRKEGLNDVEIARAVTEYNKFGKDVNDEIGNIEEEEDNSGIMRSSAFESRPTADVVRYQLELNDILERIEHLLRGDKIEVKNGNRIFVENRDESSHILNEKGVQLILSFVSPYVSRNTLLANYKKEEIDEILFNLGTILSNLIFMRYEEMGMDTCEKRKMYPSLVTQIVDMIRSCYTRAISGGERKSLTQTTHITQTQAMPIEENPEKQYRGIFGLKKGAQ